MEGLSTKKLGINLLTNNSPKSRFFIEKIKLQDKRYTSADNEGVPTFILADQKQLILMIRRSSGKSGKKTSRQRISALWTNYEAFIKALGALFIGLWNGGIKHP
jgi:hypothetical protein